jgi:predicted enzyme related to lactoylglutathione lyase
MSIHPEVTVGHVHLTVSDLDRALAFYRDILGFEVTTRIGDSAVFLSQQAGIIITLVLILGQEKELNQLQLVILVCITLLFSIHLEKSWQKYSVSL